MERELVFELPNRLDCIEEAVAFVMRRCACSAVVARRLRLNFRVSLTEALANAMIYGNDRDPSKRVRVRLLMDDRAIRACVTDEGGGFDPAQVPDPTLPFHAEAEGGRGLFLMRRLMDEVHFNDCGNSVTLVLRLDERRGVRAGISA
jgi:serine/threonine-protein kinase RsbW